jgi:hypothetical protein
MARLAPAEILTSRGEPEGISDEGGEEGPVTTVTFEDRDGETLVTVHDLYPSKEALEEALASGNTSSWREGLQQLDTLVADLGTRAAGAQASAW